MPTDTDVIRALICGIEDQISDPAELDVEVEMHSGGAVSASGGSYVHAPDADMSNSTSVQQVYLTAFPPSVADESIGRLLEIESELEKDNPDTGVIREQYDWFAETIPLVADLLKVIEQVRDVIPS